MRTPTKAQDIAQYLLWLAQHDHPDEPMYLTPMQLQKLLYYAQGWTLAERDDPLFKDRIEAWTHGPVIPDVYAEYKSWGGKPIVEDVNSLDDLTEEEKELVQAVWNRYKRHSAIALSDMTHGEEPWLKAREGLAPTVLSSRPIDLDLMRRSFRERLLAANKRLAAAWPRLTKSAEANTRRLFGRPVAE